MVNNIRHQPELLNTKEDLNRVLHSIDIGITNDILAMDIRQALHHLGEITGQIIRQEADKQLMTFWTISSASSVLESKLVPHSFFPILKALLPNVPLNTRLVCVRMVKG